MDCRKWLLVLVGLSLSCAGCVTTRDNGTTEIGFGGFLRNPFGQDKKTKRKPKAETSIAFARIQEKAAADRKCNPVTRERVLEDARSAYSLALEVEPKNVEASTGLARVYANLGDKEKAFSIFKKSLEHQPKESKIWFSLGMFYGREKKFDLAIQSFRKAVEFSPEDRTYITTLGLCLARAGHVDESVKVLSRIHGKAKANYKVARMMKHVKRPDLAREHLQVALRHNPHLMEARKMIAQLQAPNNRNRNVARIQLPPDQRATIDPNIQPAGY